MDRILKQIEIRVGESPSQYVLPIGIGRTWNREEKCWVAIPD